MIHEAYGTLSAARPGLRVRLVWVLDGNERAAVFDESASAEIDGYVPPGSIASLRASYKQRAIREW